MKKQIIIAAVSAIFFVSCSKIGTTPIDQSVSNAAPLTSGSQVTQNGTPSTDLIAAITAQRENIIPYFSPGHCYQVRNTERSEGIVAYKFVYTDCNGKDQVEELPYGQSLIFCSQSEKIKANFSFTIGDRGNCLTARNDPWNSDCTSYTISNLHGPTGVSIMYEYTDCSGLHTTGYLDPLKSATISAKAGSVICYDGIVKNNG